MSKKWGKAKKERPAVANTPESSPGRVPSATAAGDGPPAAPQAATAQPPAPAAEPPPAVAAAPPVPAPPADGSNPHSGKLPPWLQKLVEAVGPYKKLIGAITFVAL